MKCAPGMNPKCFDLWTEDKRGDGMGCSGDPPVLCTKGVSISGNPFGSTVSVFSTGRADGEQDDHEHLESCKVIEGSL